MKTRLFAITVVGLLLLVPVFLQAQATCANATTLTPNGSEKTDFDFVLNGATNNYTFTGIAGNSYTVEQREDYEGNVGGLVTLSVLSGACPGAAIAGITDTTLYEPMLTNGSRKSFIMPGTAGTTQTVQVAVGNTDVAGHYISLKVSDTTFSLTGFSTFGAAGTYVTIMNTTHSNITGTLTFYNGTNGAILKQGTVNLTAVGTAGAIASLNTLTAPWIIPVGNFGYATFAHNGPSGSLATNAIIANFSVGLVQPIGMIAPRQ